GDADVLDDAVDIVGGIVNLAAGDSQHERSLSSRESPQGMIASGRCSGSGRAAEIVTPGTVTTAGSVLVVPRSLRYNPGRAPLVIFLPPAADTRPGGNIALALAVCSPSQYRRDY